MNIEIKTEDNDINTNAKINLEYMNQIVEFEGCYNDFFKGSNEILLDNECFKKKNIYLFIDSIIEKIKDLKENKYNRMSWSNEYDKYEIFYELGKLEIYISNEYSKTNILEIKNNLIEDNFLTSIEKLINIKNNI
tara:strand:- start:1148 stop:1552 length:405 start_codon:yes stop_codon:yes gene_type:complete